MSIRLVLAEDRTLIREGLRSLFEHQSDMKVVAEASNGRQAVDLAREHRPDVVVMDTNMPHLNGAEATRQVVELDLNIKVVALAHAADKNQVGMMLEAGASGYLLKDCAFEEVLTAVRAAVANQTYLCPQAANMIVDQYVRNGNGNGKGNGQGNGRGRAGQTGLTSRERQVLQLLAEGYPTKEMGQQLNVSAKTIESHRQQLMRKLNLFSVAELTKYALREGLTSLDY